MIQRVVLEGVELPRLYIVENGSDEDVARKNGIPYIKWNQGMESLLRKLLIPTLRKMFPNIAWSKVDGVNMRMIKSDVCVCKGTDEKEAVIADDYDAEKMLESQMAHSGTADMEAEMRSASVEDWEIGTTSPIAEDYRDIPVDNSDLGYDHYYEQLSVYNYIGDISSGVNIEALMNLGLLPKFLGDITDCIRTNISNSMMWREGYTKKLGAVLGNFNNKKQLPNLIILDISASIPDGIVSTMITLIDTLRSQCEADLIITSARSGYYPAHTDLPSPQTIFDYYGRSNESTEFIHILNKYIAGREFGHVISFGDNDNPGRFNNDNMPASLIDTKIHEVHHYHTWKPNTPTGYATWCKYASPQVAETFDTSWCHTIK